jgi:hypothetical protein
MFRQQLNQQILILYRNILNQPIRRIKLPSNSILISNHQKQKRFLLYLLSIQFTIQNEFLRRHLVRHNQIRPLQITTNLPNLKFIPVIHHHKSTLICNPARTTITHLMQIVPRKLPIRQRVKTKISSNTATNQRATHQLKR